MKYRLTILFFFLSLVSCKTGGKYYGFTKLFNGNNFENWEGVFEEPYNNPYKRGSLIKSRFNKYKKIATRKMKKHWKVVDGTLHYDGSKKGRSLMTRKKYSNFEFYVSWKLEKNGDSGIYLKSTPQIQIWDPSNKAVRRHGAHRGSGGLWNNKNGERFPLKMADKPIGQWNTFYIKMLNDYVTVYLNDTLIVDKVKLENYWWRGKPLLRNAPIELQTHGSKVWFKDIYIKELK